MIEKTLLSCGATVITEMVEHTETVSVGFWLLSGSRDEKQNEHGFSHFLEHMLFKGTQKRSSFKIAQEIDRVGGSLNAFTEKEYTCYYCTLPGEHLLLAVDVISDMLLNSLLLEEEIEKEKQVVLHEIQASEDTADEIAYDEFLAALWGDHPLATKITGEAKDILQINRKNLVDFYKKWYQPSNMLIAISGHLIRKEVVDYLEKVFPVNNTGFTEKYRDVPRTADCWDYRSSHFSQVHVYTGLDFSIPKRIEEFYHFLVFSTLFGESMSSRLFQNIREDKGLCYSIYSMRSFYHSLATWTIYASTSPDLLDQLVKALNNELIDVLYNSISAEEIDNAITHLIGGIIISKDDMEVRMKRIVRHFVLGGKIHDIPATISILGKITLKDIEEFRNSYLTGKPFQFMAYGPKKLHRRKKQYFTFP